jgi:hypothetical protein
MFQILSLRMCCSSLKSFMYCNICLPHSWFPQCDMTVHAFPKHTNDKISPLLLIAVCWSWHMLDLFYWLFSAQHQKISLCLFFLFEYFSMCYNKHSSNFLQCFTTRPNSSTWDLCDTDDVQDEQHVLFHCANPHVSSLRRKYASLFSPTGAYNVSTSSSQNNNKLYFSSMN